MPRKKSRSRRRKKSATFSWGRLFFFLVVAFVLVDVALLANQFGLIPGLPDVLAKLPVAW